MSSLDLSKSLKSREAIKNLLSSASNNSDKKEVNIDTLITYKNHPFKLYTDERLDGMIESIKQVGILSPIIVRKKEDDKLEILSGHNRTNAAKLAGLKTVPVVIMDVDDDTADRIVVESNFIQRTEFLPSEKAKAYKLLLDSLNRQGKKTSISNFCSNGTEVVTKESEIQENSRDIVAKYYNTSSIQVQRYIRLNFLIDGLLKMVDDKVLSFRPAVEISYLDKKSQSNIECFINMGHKISLKHAQALREKFERIGLTTNDIANLLPEKEQNEKSERNIVIPLEKLKGYFNDLEGVTDEEIIEKIISFLKPK